MYTYNTVHPLVFLSAGRRRSDHPLSNPGFSLAEEVEFSMLARKIYIRRTQSTEILLADAPGLAGYQAPTVALPHLPLRSQFRRIKTISIPRAGSKKPMILDPQPAQKKYASPR
jgi:hypothetical protein